MGLEILAGVGLGIAAIGTASSIDQSNKARKASEKANKINSRISERRSQREKIQSLREARVKNAQIGVQSAMTGTQNASASQGAQASLQQQLGTNLSFVEQIQGLQQTVQQYQQSASASAGRANAYSGIAGLALQGASMAGSVGGTPNSETLGSSQAGYSSQYMG